MILQIILTLIAIVATIISIVISLIAISTGKNRNWKAEDEEQSEYNKRIMNSKGRRIS